MSNETLGIVVNVSGTQQAVAAFKGLTDAQARVADANAKSNAEARAGKDVAAQYIEQLKREQMELGKTATQLREIEARYRGANAAQVERVRTLSAEIEASKAASTQGGILANVMGLVTRAAGAMALAMAVAAPALALSNAQDEAKVLLSRITQVTGSLNESRAVYRGLTEDAIRLRVGLTDTLSGYTRISMAVKELGGTSTQARQLNEMVIGTAKIMGVTAGEAAAAARQFAQALGSGVLQGDELRSILENNQELARQLATGLGVSIGSLRKMGEEGKLTADVVANALLSRLPEMRAKLAEVPLTSADAWQKLTSVLSAWVVQGDQVEMKAGLIARAMNAIADGIDRARKLAATPITVTVRQVYETQGGAAFVGPNLGRRDPAAIAAEAQVAINAENTRRGSHVAAIRAADNEIVAASRIGLELMSKKALEDAEKYADSVALGSAKIQKTYDKEMKAIAAQRAGLTKALTSGDPASVALATATLEKLAKAEVAFTVDMQRKLAEAKKSEASKGHADIESAASAHYRKLLAKEEAYQAAIKADVKAGIEVEKRKYDDKLTDATTYYTAVATLQNIGLNLQQASVEKELAAARSRGQKGLADAEKFAAELIAIERERSKIAGDTNDAILAADRVYWSARIAEMRAFDEAASKYAEGTYAVIKSAQDIRGEQLFQVSLLGQTAQAQERAIALRKIEIERTRDLTAAQAEYYRVSAAARTEEERAAAAGGLAVRVKAINDAKDAQAGLTVEVLATSSAYSQMSGFVDGFISAAFKGFKSLKDFLKNQLFDWLKQSLLKPFIMQIAASVTGSLGATAASAAGGSGIVGSVVSSVVSSVLGAGSFLGGILGTGGLAAAGTALTSTLAATGSVTAALGAAGASLVASGGILGAAASVLAAIPVVGWIALAAGAAYLALGGRNDGFKIDNNLTNVGNPASHFTANAISAYDVSGRGSDSAQTRATLKPLTDAVAVIDDLLANKLLGADVLARIRTNMNAVNNATSWENLDAKGIEKGSKDFLMQRYGVIFDQVDARIAASVRGFTGTSEALLVFIGSVVGVMQTLKDNAAYFAAIVGDTISVGQLVDLGKEGETLAQTLNRVITVFAATNGVAALMGKDVTTAFGAVGLASLAARQNLIDLAGGISALDSMSKFFYENFYTQQERDTRNLAAAGASVAATFAELNIAVPATRAEFRALVEAQDLTTEAGRRTWTSLMRIAGAFTTVTAEVDRAVERTARWDGVMPTDPTRSLGQGSAVAQATRAAPSQAYLDAFFTDAERAAMSLAASGKLVTDTFRRYDIAVPTTMAGFRALVESIDRSTEAGEAFYQVLMGLVPAFVAVNAVAAATKPTEASDSYLANYFTASEQAAYKAAQAQRSVTAAFAEMGVKAPTTRAEFVALVNAQDQSTEAGRRMVAMLMAVEPAFTTLTGAANDLAVAAAAAAAATRGAVGDLLANATTRVQQTLAATYAIIDSTSETLAVKLQRKLAAVSALAAQYDSQSGDSTAARYAAELMAGERSAVAADLALLTSLTAQYGARAEAMFELEKWRTEQVALARGSTTQLLLIDQSYQQRRNAILTGGVAAGLASVSTVLQDWLKSLALNSQLTTLTPAQRLAEARSQYTSALASGSDSELTRAADAYLREARESFASGDAYSQIFNMIREQVAARANAVTPVASTTPPAGSSSGSVGGGSTAATTASTVAASAATTAVAAANATVDAVNATKALLAEIMAQTKNAVVSEGRATRAADASNTQRVVEAVGNREYYRALE